jgi:diguanylate cyclase (GGDEF)-like protein
VRGEDLQQWLLTVGTATLAAVLVGGLKSRVERLVDEVAEAAQRDARTGLLNGSGFEELLDRELERAQRSEAALSVIVVDLDRFKDVNDELGHRVADERLAIVADLLERTKRRIDVVARMSGQEFVLLLPETDEHGAYVLADRLRRAVRDHFTGDALATTASLGVASFPKHEAMTADRVYKLGMPHEAAARNCCAAPAASSIRPSYAPSSTFSASRPRPPSRPPPSGDQSRDRAPRGSQPCREPRRPSGGLARRRISAAEAAAVVATTASHVGTVVTRSGSRLRGGSRGGAARRRGARRRARAT